MNTFPKSTHWEPLRPPGHLYLSQDRFWDHLRPSYWRLWPHFGPRGCPRSSTAPQSSRKGDPKRAQWAPKRKLGGARNAINTWGNAWSHMKNAINTWGSCMPGSLKMHFGTQWNIKNENAINTWGNHIYWAKKWINTWGSCMSEHATDSCIFEKVKKHYGFSLSRGVQLNPPASNPAR